MKRVLIKFLN